MSVWNTSGLVATNIAGLVFTNVASSSDGKRLIACCSNIAGVLPTIILISTDSGVTWNQCTSLFFPDDTYILSWNSVASDSTGQYLVVGSLGASNGYYGVYRSTDYGSTWAGTNGTLNSSELWYSISSSADGTKLVACTYNYIFVYSTTNPTWTRVYSGGSGWESVSSNSNGTVLIACGNGGIYVSINSGSTWNKSDAPTLTRSSTAISSDGSICLASSFDTTYLYVSTNFGTNWTKISALSKRWRGVAMDSSGSSLLACYEYDFITTVRGGVYKSTDLGTSWQIQNQVLPYTGVDCKFFASIACSSSGQTIVTAVNTISRSQSMPITNKFYGAMVYTSNDSGSSWYSPNISTAVVPFTNIAGDQTGTKLIASTKWSTVHLSTDSGNTWSQARYTTYPYYVITSLTSSSSGQYLALVNSNYNVFTSNNWGVNWNYRSTGSSESWKYIINDPTGAILLVFNTSNSIVYRSSDYGSTWTSSGQVRISDYVGALARNSTGQLFCASSTGVRQSNDFGITWNLISGSPAPSYLVACDSSGQYLLSYNSTNIYRSDNSGNTWSITDAPSLNWSKIASDSTGQYPVLAMGYGTYENTKGSIYVSTNYGANWSKSDSPIRPWFDITYSSSGSKIAGATSYYGVYRHNFLLTCQQFISQGYPSNTLIQDTSSNVSTYITTISAYKSNITALYVYPYAPVNLNATQYVQGTNTNGHSYIIDPSGIIVTDSSFNLLDNINILNVNTIYTPNTDPCGNIISIVPNDGLLYMSVSYITTNPYTYFIMTLAANTIMVTGAAISELSNPSLTIPQIAGIQVSDTSANISTYFSQLNANVTKITITDGSYVSLSYSQITTYTNALAALSSNTVVVSGNILASQAVNIIATTQVKSINVSDTASNISTYFNSLNSSKIISTTITDGGTVYITPTQFTTYTYTVSSLPTNSIIIVGASISQSNSIISSPHTQVKNIQISDTSSNILTNFANLNTPTIVSSITSTTGLVTLSYTQLSTYTYTVSLLPSQSINFTAGSIFSTSQTIYAAVKPQVVNSSMSIGDTAKNIQSNLRSLISISVINKVNSINVTDSPPNKVYVTSQEYATLSNGGAVQLNSDQFVIIYVCFKEGTKILTMYGYMPVEQLKRGTMIQTLKNGYVPINMLGKKEIYHIAKEERIKSQLYKCSQTEYPELFEDLVITGCHSILVDNFASNEEREQSIEVNGALCVTDNKYRVPACVDKRTRVYETPGNYTIYHFALENNDYYANYGVYANGLLVETCSKRFIKEESDMILY